MTTNAEGVLTAVRAETGTTYGWPGDWLALFALESITTGSFNERMLAWINVQLGTSYTNLPEAQQAFAVDQGFANWASMNTFSLVGSGAGDLLGSETQGLALDFTDDYYFATTSQYGSAKIIDTGTPANDYDSHPYGKLTYTSPSAKMTLGPSGTLRFGAMNLYLNSASPADQSVTVVSGATYAVTITGSVSTTASGAATGTWTAGTQEFTAATGTLTFGSTSGSGTVHVRRTPSDSTYLETAGSARYSLPFEWSTAGVLQGILVEEARTNLATYSQDFDNAAWAKGAATITTNATTAPDGTSTADRFVETSSTAAHEIYGVSTSGTLFCWSIFAKADTSRYIGLAIYNAGSDVYSAHFDLQTGTFTQQDNQGSTFTSRSYGIQDYGNGWYRIWITAARSSGFATFSIGIATTGTPTVSSNGLESYAGNTANGLYIWGAQVEAAAFPTSYIPTIGSTVTRAADNITLATSAFPYAQTAATLYAEFTNLSSPASAGFPIIGVDSGVADNENTIYRVSGTTDLGVYVTSSATLQYTSTTSGTINASSTNKVALATTLNDGAAVINGTVGSTDTSLTMPLSPTTLRIGVNSSSASLNGRLRRVMVLPRRMANADLQSLTT